MTGLIEQTDAQQSLTLPAVSRKEVFFGEGLDYSSFDYMSIPELFSAEELLAAEESLYTVRQVEQGESLGIATDGLEQMRRMLTWTQEFIMQPHPQMGRKGDICPYVRPSIQEEQFFMAVSHIDYARLSDEIFRTMILYAHIFRESMRLNSKKMSLKTYLIIFPDVPTAEAETIIEPVYKELKTQLLRHRIMTGQFYPGCKTTSTYNPNFRVLQSPVPMIALRELLETDWRFLQGNAVWEDQYKSFFGFQPAKA